MKKHILAALFAIVLATFATLKAETSYFLLVNTSDGNTVEYDFEYLPVATFEGDVMIITDDRSAEGTRFAMENVVNMTIKTASSAVGDISASNHIKVSVINGKLTVSGLESNSNIVIYDAAGSAVASATADLNGIVELNIGNLGKGVYVISMPNHSFKFIR